MAAFDTIARGSSANDGTGDPVRDAFGKVNDNFAKAANLEEDNTFEGFMSFGTPESVTIASGVATITKTYIKLDGQSAGADDLDTISGGASEGTIVILKNTSATITVTQNGNIRIEGSTKTLSSQTERLVLQYDGDQSVWVQIAYSAD